jgi:hypothetical protein
MPSTSFCTEIDATVSDFGRGDQNEPIRFRPQAYLFELKRGSAQQSYHASIQDAAETKAAARSALVRIGIYGLNFIAAQQSADDSRNVARGLAMLLASSGALGMQALQEARGGSDETAFLDVIEALGGVDDTRAEVISSVQRYLDELQADADPSVSEIARDALEQIVFNTEPVAVGV